MPRMVTFLEEKKFCRLVCTNLLRVRIGKHETQVHGELKRAIVVHDDVHCNYIYIRLFIINISNVIQGNYQEVLDLRV